MSVEIKKLELDCTKEAYEVGEALQKIIIACKKALADGFQVGQDAPVILVESLPALLVAMEGMAKLGEESKMTVEFVNSWLVASSKIAGEFLKK